MLYFSVMNISLKQTCDWSMQGKAVSLIQCLSKANTQLPVESKEAFCKLQLALVKAYTGLRSLKPHLTTIS